MNPPVIFLDAEIDPNTGKVLDFAAIAEQGKTFHSTDFDSFTEFIGDSEYFCGHNLIHHDFKYICNHLSSDLTNKFRLIDTLYLSPLLFPNKPYHHLVKDDKLHSEDISNPLNDSIKASDLFYDEIAAFSNLDLKVKNIFYFLLKDQKEFKDFFSYISYKPEHEIEIKNEIKDFFSNKICSNSNIDKFLTDKKTELAYALALINARDKYSITPPWVLRNYPEIERVIYNLRDKQCMEDCKYCDSHLNPHNGLKHYFDFDTFRLFNGEKLQENAVEAAVEGKSILVIFPTGGGKSLTFQLPALMSGENTRGLTVVISPLQSLMKDQVDNLEKAGIVDAVTINGSLDPIERAKSYERVEDGSASLLYISPESLRSKSIARLLLNRRIARFVIDEAHCFSSWGQDFRVDYLYIAEFIKKLIETKGLTIPIPVSCFTATAKQKVIADIKKYFKNHLSCDLELFKTDARRTNLQYQVYSCKDNMEKYNKLRHLLESKECPAIVYVSRTRKATELADQLRRDGFNALSYHGKMDIQLKTENQNAFSTGAARVMVATSAFGMGVDKKDVGMVIHHDISDSLENYVQEAGRAGRDEKISAECFVLFNEEDLDKHFILLNQTKISIKEIQQIWRSIKDLTQSRSRVSNSALEIARQAGWDDSVVEIETRVTTAIAALEQANYLKRGQNSPRIYANSILVRNAKEAIDIINASQLFDEKDKVKAARIIKKLFSAKSRKHTSEEEAESRIDYISDHLGIVREDVIRIIRMLREVKILADKKDLTAFIKHSENRSLNILQEFNEIENLLLKNLHCQDQKLNLKEVNSVAREEAGKEFGINKIKTVLNFWAIKNWVKCRKMEGTGNHVRLLCKQHIETLKKLHPKRYELARFILELLYEKAIEDNVDSSLSEVLVEFSVLELKEAYETSDLLFSKDISPELIEDALFYLSRIGAIKIEGGFLVIYNKLTIERLEKNNKIQYKNEDYNQLGRFYESRKEQIHIVGEYAAKMLEDYNDALKFVDDYFQLEYKSFLKRYFPGSRKDDLKKSITPGKFKELFGTLSPGQLKIINDSENKNIVVAAGPGSGKTKVLAHKLASLLLMEDVKHEQLLMLTFSRAAATEFKKRLRELVGNAANFVEIKTFHSYCFDLLGRVGSLEKTDVIIKQACEKISNAEIEPCRIMKHVLVIDEAQDISRDEYELIKTLSSINEEMRIIAVGDDDQNIFTFRGADSKYFASLLEEPSSIKYELVDNYRSTRNLVDFSNQFVSGIKNRLKHTPIHAINQSNGEIRITKHENGNFSMPLVNNILNDEILGTLAILTQTNEEAFQLAGLLLKNGLPAQLIQSNDGFNLFDMLELRYFYNSIAVYEDTPTIGDDLWKNQVVHFREVFENSNNFELCNMLIDDFHEINPKTKYKTDLETFIRESKLEDLNTVKSAKIAVSTIHKAKGKEFDNLYLLLDRFKAIDDDEKRKLYVAITRAKQNLTIHFNNSVFDNISVDGMKSTVDSNSYPEPDELVLHLNHRDIFLNYFEDVQDRIDLMLSGYTLRPSINGLHDHDNKIVVKYSNAFKEKIEQFNKQGLHLTEASVNHILYWKSDDENSREIKILLPKIILKKPL